MWILNKIKKAFKAVKKDICDLEEHQRQIKRSTHEWILHLNSENSLLRSRLTTLEKRLEKIDDEKLGILREI